MIPVSLALAGLGFVAQIRPTVQWKVVSDHNDTSAVPKKKKHKKGKTSTLLLTLLTVIL